MYLEHFQLTQAPFSITPDPRFVYLSDRHRDGLAHLLYGLGQEGSGGFVVLTGEVGTGKTTLCRLALENLPAQTIVALVLNPKLNPVELLETICEELQVDIAGKRGSQKYLVDALNAKLLAAHADGKRVVLMLDEAQNLSTDALEQVRLLTNLETATQKLLQIILLGQPELNQILERPELRQLAQRITARFHLLPLNLVEAKAYLQHRLQVAGTSSQRFDQSAIQKIHQASAGIPRLMNVLADHSLLAAFRDGTTTVSGKQATAAIHEVLPQRQRQARQVLWYGAVASLVGASIFALFWLALRGASYSFEPITVSSPNAAKPLATGSNQSTAANATDPAAALLAAHGITTNFEMQQALLTCKAQFTLTKRCLRGRANAQYLRSLKVPYLRDEFDAINNVIKLTISVAPVDYSGNFIALYDLPSDIPMAFSAGYAGPGVSLLAERLAKRDGGPTAQRIYGPRMSERVIRLQRELGIPADGVVGPATWLALSEMAR
jgi:general secretion pathway protein A